MPVNEDIEEPQEKKHSFLVKFKRSLHIGKKCKERGPDTSLEAGQSHTSKHSSLKYVNLIPAHKMKKREEDAGHGGEKLSDDEEGSGALKAADIEEFPTFSGSEESKKRDAGNIDMTNKKFARATEQVTEGAEELLRLYREMHEIRKRLIMKEKQFQDENLEFYKLQLEAENIFSSESQE